MNGVAVVTKSFFYYPQKQKQKQEQEREQERLLPITPGRQINTNNAVAIAVGGHSEN